MAVGLASGLAAIAFAALLPDAVAYIYLGAQLAGIGWVYFGFGVADGRPSAIAVQVLSAGVFLSVGFLGAYHESTVLLGVGFLAHGGSDWLHHNDQGPTHVRTCARGTHRSALSPTSSSACRCSPAGCCRRLLTIPGSRTGPFTSAPRRRALVQTVSEACGSPGLCAGLVTGPFDELDGRALHARIEECVVLVGGRGLIVTRRA
jgi:hypothetical protein